jgi:mRNA-degrading endonuclease toxin of MazEF toxin-antitoxin module
VPIKQGDILWATCTDPQGANEKRRPVVVLTRTEEIVSNAPIVGAAITTSFPRPATHEYVELPWNPTGSVRTGLKRPCAVWCRWIVELDQDSIDEICGHVSGAKLREIVEKVNEIGLEPG